MVLAMDPLMRKFCTLALIISGVCGVNGYDCSGYYDTWSSAYHSGFDCPRWYDSYDAYYCCGSSYKYCCDYSTYLLSGYDDDDDDDDDDDSYWEDWSDATSLGVTIIVGIVGGVVGFIILVVVCIFICVYCCANSGSGTQATTTHVVQNPAVQPNVVSYSVQNQQSQVGYYNNSPVYTA